MHLSKIALGFGWIVAIGAVAGCFLLLDRLLEMRAKERLTSVQLTVDAETGLPENWNSAPRRVLLVGDSRVRRWTTLPAAPGIAFGKSGVGGETVGQLERRFAGNVLELTPAPQELVIAIGVNDLVAASLYARWGEGFQTGVITEMMARLEGLVDAARARGIEVRLATIIQAAEPDLLRRLTFWDDSLPPLIDEANAAIAALASELGLEVVDFNALLDGGSGPLPGAYAVDTLHFSPAAYEVLNAGLLEAFAAQ